MPPNSPTGFNEGIVAGFTRGLQDGYFAGFQSAQTGASQRGGISPPTALAANPGGLSQTSLPHALPHVSSGGPLPRNLLEAQRKAVLDYTSELKERIEQLERRSRPSIIPPGVDTPTTRSEIDQVFPFESRIDRKISDSQVRQLRSSGIQFSGEAMKFWSQQWNPERKKTRQRTT